MRVTEELCSVPRGSVLGYPIMFTRTWIQFRSCVLMGYGWNLTFRSIRCVDRKMAVDMVSFPRWDFTLSAEAVRGWRNGMKTSLRDGQTIHLSMLR